MPDRRVGTANPTGKFSPIVIGVSLTQNKASCIPYNLSVTTISQIRQRKQAGNIGIVHQIILPETVHLVSINFSVILCLNNPVPPDSFFDLLSETGGFRLHLFTMIYYFLNLFQIPQHDYGKHIGGNQIAICAGVVAGTETRPRQSDITFH